jgi:hypothetical protein
MTPTTEIINEISIPAVHTFLRDLNILLKSARMYGNQHSRTVAQSAKAWESLQAVLTSGGKNALQIAAAQDRLFVNGAPVKSGPTESSFAQMLTAGDLASITFRPTVTSENFHEMVRIFVENGSRPRGLAAKMKAALGSEADACIRIDEVRFVPADPSRPDHDAVAGLLARSLNSSIGKNQVHVTQPEELLRMLSATETDGPGTAPARGGPPTLKPEVAEEETATVIRLLAKLARQNSGEEPIDGDEVQEELKGLSQQGRNNLRRIITELSSSASDGPTDHPLLLKVAEDLAIRLAIERYGNGDSRIDAVTGMLRRMSTDIESLRGAIGTTAETDARASDLEQEFWNQTSVSERLHVLLSDEAWHVPPRHIRKYLEQLTESNDKAMLERVLLNYVNCIHNPFPAARRAVATGLGELAGSLSSPVSHSLRFAIREVGERLIREEDADLQKLLTNTFVLLGQEAVGCGRYGAVYQVVSSLEPLEKSNPELASYLRANVELKPRIPEFIEEALRAPEVPEELIELLRHVSRVAVEHISSRLSRCNRRRERERLVNLAMGLTAEAPAVLREACRVRPPSAAVKTIALLSRLDPVGLEKLLPTRLPGWNRMYQDTAILQIAAAGSVSRGKLMAASLLAVDPLLVPLVIDEIGMSGDQSQAALLLRIATGELPSLGSVFIRIKAMEGLGRLRATAAVSYLVRVIGESGSDAKKSPRELRIVAAQSLRKIDPAGAKAILAKAGFAAEDLEPIPCDPTKETPGSRQRYHPRFRLPRPQPAKITTAEGEFSAPILGLNISGGLCATDKEFVAGTSGNLKMRMGVRAFAAKILLRNSKKDQTAFEIVDIDPEDRGRLRSFLQGLRR